MDQVQFHKVPPNCGISLSITTRFKKAADYKGYWIGVDKKSYIICRLNGADSSTGINLISEGCEVNARFHWDGKLIAFRSEIVALINEPARWMILQYPQNVMSMPLRKYDRYECYQPATLHLDSKHVLRGVLKDISERGCKFVPSAANKFNINVLKDKNLQLQTRFPKRDEPVILTCQIKNTPNERNEFALGCQFVQDYELVNQQIEYQLVDKAFEKKIQGIA